MLLVRKNHNLLPDFPGFFDDFFTKEFHDYLPAKFANPAVNVKETETEFQVEVAAPGLKKEDFKIEVNENVLTIASERKEEKAEKEGDKYTRKEFSYQSFKRAFTLPKHTVDADNIEAKYIDGVLNLVIPKKAKEEVNPTRVIEIE